MTTIEPATNAPTNPNQEDTPYPNRENLKLTRRTGLEKHTAAINANFMKDFRNSCFHFKIAHSTQQKEILDPPRSEMISHLKIICPSYKFPNVLTKNEGLKVEKVKSKVDDSIDTELIIKIISEKNLKVKAKEAEDDDDEEKKTEEEDEAGQEVEDEDDLGGEYNAAAYEDLETGEDADLDEDSDDND